MEKVKWARRQVRAEGERWRLQRRLFKRQNAYMKCFFFTIFFFPHILIVLMWVISLFELQVCRTDGVVRAAQNGC